MRKLFLSFPLLLAACASPYEVCVHRAQKDVRVLDGLIEKSQGNIRRGYGIRSEEYFETEKQVCGKQGDKVFYCDVAVPKTRDVPVAIDLAAEKAKLQSLIKTRAQKLRAANNAAAQCRLRHPEG